MRLVLLAALALLAGCATPPPQGEVAAVAGLAPLAPARRMVLDAETRASFHGQCLDAARARQSETVAERYCGCVIATAQTYVPAEEWTDAILPKPASPIRAPPIGATFARVARSCGTLVEPPPA